MLVYQGAETIWFSKTLAASWTGVGSDCDTISKNDDEEIKISRKVEDLGWPLPELFQL